MNFFAWIAKMRGKKPQPEMQEPDTDNEITHIGIDLGTVNTVVYISGKGLVFNEPSTVAFDAESGSIIAAGYRANAMIGKAHDKIRVVRQLVHGAVSDSTAAKAFLKHIITTHYPETALKHRTTLLVCCHANLSKVERKALKDLAKSIGIEDVLVENEIKAGAAGMDIDYYKPGGTLIADIGGGSTDIGVLSLGDLVVNRSTKTAGNCFDREIMNYLKFKRNFEIGPATAEKLKIELATLRSEISSDKFTMIAGRNIKNGLPGTIKVKQTEIRDVLVKSFRTVVEEIYKVLEVCPPEISSEILDEGIYVNGGGSKIDGLKEFLEERLQLPVTLSKDPLNSIALGTKVLLKNRGNYRVNPFN